MRPHNGESSYGKSTLSRAVHPHYPIIRKTPPPWGMVLRNMLCFRSDTVLLEVFFPITKVVLFIQKLTEILENSEECRGTYELVPISGNDPHEISNVLVGMHNAANIEMHNPEANGVH